MSIISANVNDFLNVFVRVLLNFSGSGILGLFAAFGFEVNKASLVISDILLN